MESDEWMHALSPLKDGSGGLFATDVEGTLWTSPVKAERGARLVQQD